MAREFKKTLFVTIEEGPTNSPEYPVAFESIDDAAADPGCSVDVAVYTLDHVATVRTIVKRELRIKVKR